MTPYLARGRPINPCQYHTGKLIFTLKTRDERPAGCTADGG